MAPRVWASANTIKLCDEWLYVFLVLWFEDKRYVGLPIQHNIVFQDHCYLYNSEDTFERYLEEVAHHMRRMEILLEKKFEELDKAQQQELGL